MENKLSLFFLFLCWFSVIRVKGHGMMLDPPNRSSLWRFVDASPTNYNDNQNFCGGFGVQWYQNEGKCGVCGDNYADPRPRDNENTGTYGNKVIVAQYLTGSVINVSILLTANHLGYFNYSICNLEDNTSPEPEDCFIDVPLIDKTYKYPVDSTINSYVNYLQLPNNFTCEHCVLRWNYNTGNSWGDCGNGTGAIGCGAQETFRSCADVRIVENDSEFDNDVTELFNSINYDLNAILNEI